MKKYFLLASFIFAAFFCTAQTKKITVAQNGSGDYKTVQEALDAVPLNNTVPVEIFIKKGVYREKLHLDSSRDHVRITGVPGETVLTYDDHTGSVAPDGSIINTMTSQTFYIGANDVKLVYLTIENTAGLTAGQAVAVRVQGDRVFFLNCRIIGFQDTLFTSGADSRQYYRNCLIEGSTDFIFGPSTALFDECLLRSKKNSHVTAASTPEGNEYGYVFRACKLVADSGLNKVSLGRPWRPYASVTYIACKLDGHIIAGGWDNWNNPANEKTVRYAEYRNSGAGASPKTRVPWSRQLKDEEVKQFTIENILRGWNPYGEQFVQPAIPWLPTGRGGYQPGYFN
ncbi:pectin esterase [Sediminibacterium roseum]|uniref:Pectinesterase n=1 Tax=Sediminibacterium roseum TaxID=1978412 RepID=A0ABW9ZYK9_9BACT|nr:pectinesterase family protein [Sediminibacterium roseum]NCI51630.1 pectin esterase [Sediminibacterium roseum]